MQVNNRKKQRLKGKIMAAGVAALLLASPASAEEMEEFSLDPVSVTATRSAKRDLDIPATVNVYTGKELEATGATTVIEALKYAEGIVYHSQGPAGQSMSTMTSKVVIRGQDRGTLVMINGVPINLRGGYSIENMPIVGIERIEIVKGTGSVLYGSDATGGVINIITKDKMDKTVFASFGNYEKRDAGMSWQEGKLGFAYQNSHMANVDHYGESYTSNIWYNLIKSDKDMYTWNYKFNDHLSISQVYARNRYLRSSERFSNGTISGKNDYDAYQNLMNMKYENKGFKGNLFYNYRTIYNQAITASGAKGSQSTNKDSMAGLDIQQAFDLPKGKLTVGGNAQREYTASRSNANNPLVDRDRMDYALFAQWEVPFNDRWEMILGARETWTGGADNDHNFSNFSPQVQFLYKANANTSFYASAAKTFIMPTLTQMYGSGSIVGNPNIKPQTGYQYEIGMKHTKGIHSWRVAVFNLDIKNYISPQTVMGGNVDTTYTNEDRRNTGLEISYGLALKNGFDVTLGAVLSDPQYKEMDAAGNVMPWERQYGRLQFNFGLNYNKDKWAASLYGSYMGDRKIVAYNYTNGVITGRTEREPEPLIATGMRIAYKPAQHHEFYCNIDNLLNRDGITTNTANTSSFYQMGRNFEIGYRYNF